MEEIKLSILPQVIKQRPSNSHKGTFGRILLIGGSKNYGGAIMMATEGALNSGAGLLFVATDPFNATALHTRNPEAMFIDWNDQKKLAEIISTVDIIICGMGLDTNDFARKILVTLKDNITNKQTVVLDASALDLLSQDHNLLPKKANNIIFTPHQMEWQRLSGIKIAEQNDANNIEALKELVAKEKAYLVLKSNHTKIYDREGSILLNPLGNPGMATGGMGDTLAGIIGSFCGQFGINLKIIGAAVYLHSLAGDEIYQNNYFVRPTNLSALLPKLMKKYGEKN
ncbi:NAD(P)H-hydrate dehydratase [Lactobacillus sp.]|uniref:NAD(P)H-hydrate dehydratase n=1 Tax=Lactobacillus sp. TaxID=1591 RepID=UPI00199D441E|nr:NAD(P)H-hydrate dehydratase [Lactobacillus sp.]MBD5429084.1 NAD(P)H-hydrate dehydratase [Lactobacillus sp.]